MRIGSIKSNPQSSARSEIIWVLGVSAIVVAATFVPYVVGWLRQTPELFFSGILFNSIDANVYLAVMQQGRHGSWLMSLPFTAEAHPPMFLYEFYILLGNICRWLGVTPLIAYHAVRGLGGLGLLLAAYDYIRVHIASVAIRKVAFLLLCMGSGFGWLMQVIRPVGPDGISSIDFWLMDAYVFFSILLVPHFSVAWALALTLLASMTRAAFMPGWKLGPFAFVSGLGLSIAHPKIAPVIIMTAILSAITLSWLHRSGASSVLGVFAAAMMGAGLPLLYYFYLALTNPVFEALARQDITMSPPFGYYVTGFGAVSILGAIGGLRVYKRRVGREALMLVWLFTAMIMLYAPLQFQRRFIMGAQTPLSALAAIGLVTVVLPWIRRLSAASPVARWYSPRRLRMLSLNLVIAFCTLSNLLLLGAYSMNAWLRSPAIFIPRGVAMAADWLRQAAASDLTLAAYPTGNYIPARSGARTCIGHWNLTLDFYQKQDTIDRIFSREIDDTERERLLQTLKCRFLFYGPAEQQLGPFDPDSAHYFRRRYSAHGVVIYEFIP
ncbi:MAG: hypothetical protein FJ030_00800 [Chloroflexi bacterium]|nr:hypothetical protein [Chloroflexota bacterium]